MKMSKTFVFVSLTLFSLNLNAAAKPKCDITIEGTDTMQFQVGGKKLDSIEMPSACKEFKVTLKHVGKLKKEVMGHDFVVSLDSDVNFINSEALKLGAAKDYLPKMGEAPFKGKVLAVGDKLLSGCEAEVIKINPKNFDKSKKYEFFCTFPGHSALMKGEFKVN